MPQNNASIPRTRNRIERGFSFPHLEERRRDSLLRSAWMSIVSGFDCRPDPRSSWDETAQHDQTPWKYTLAPMRNAMAAAVMIGNPELINATAQGIKSFCRELEADVLSLIPAREEESPVQIALEETKREGEANEVEMALVRAPDPITADKAILPLERQYERLGQLIKGCRRLARSAPLVSVRRV